ncbi:MAG: regulatory iron-sulfur-containing complex subunit RicT, partial [Chitinophagaceae bacterium]
GCKSNGGCSTGGCNRLNVHDWLRNLPIADIDNSCRVIEVSFKQGSRKDFFRNTTVHYFEKGDLIAVEGVGGYDVGEVSLTGELVRLQMKKHGVDENNPDMKKVLRKAGDRDLENYTISKAREPHTLARSREIARDLNLQMKLSEVEIQADGRKATFFYTADDRVDFRELIKQFAAEFKVKVEMRQIGIRQEAAKVGGIGSCGRELCCSTWLHDFKSVNTTAARYQNLSINQTKLSGQCGRLKCCLNYELDTYLDALQHFPDNAESLEIAKGTAYLIKKDIFKNLMWYTLQGGSKHYPLTIERVKEIKRLNNQGIKPDDLEPVEVISGKPKAIEPQFVDVVGQISLKTLEKADRKKREERNNRNRPQNKQGQQQGQKPQGNIGYSPRQPQTNQPQAPANSNQQQLGNRNRPNTERQQGSNNPNQQPKKGPQKFQPNKPPYPPRNKPQQ